MDLILYTTAYPMRIGVAGQKVKKVYQPRTDRRSNYQLVRQVQYHISEWGDPQHEPMFLLHGWGDCGSSFQFLVDELRENWFVLAPDWRGFGESRQRAAGYWFPDYLADLDAILQHYAPDEPVRIVGHSMGANVAGLYAGARPERVRAFVNVEGFGLSDSDAADAPDHYRKWIAASASPPGFTVYDDFSDLAQRVLRGSPRMPMDRAMYVAQQWAARNESGGVELKADPAHKLPNPVQYRRSEAIACWRRITAPVLAVIGADSRFARGAESWNESVSDGASEAGLESQTIADAGHMVHLEQPERLARVIEKFFATL